jgi:hypothetical protein
MTHIINPNLPKPFKIEIDVNPALGQASMKPIMQDPLLVIGVMCEMMSNIAKMALQAQSMIVGRKPGTVEPETGDGNNDKKDS